jgi:DNA-binding NarL/FixJ family response regulator
MIDSHSNPAVATLLTDGKAPKCTGLLGQTAYCGHESPRARPELSATPPADLLNVLGNDRAERFVRLALETLFRSTADEPQFSHLRPHLAAILAANTPSQVATSLDRSCLSSRELQILSGIASGMTNKQIARSLGVAPETIKSHIKSIFTKLRCVTRAQAVARAELYGWL